MVKSGGFGLLGNMVVGVVGAVIGGYLLGKLGVSLGQGVFGFLATAVVGAVVLLFVVNLIRKV